MQISLIPNPPYERAPDTNLSAVSNHLTVTRKPLANSDSESTAKQLSTEEDATSPTLKSDILANPSSTKESAITLQLVPNSTNAAAQQYPQASGSTGDWVIGPAEKAKYDSIYATLDRTNRGFITGDEALPFFSASKLPEEALAHHLGPGRHQFSSAFI
jgi:hypothetical protein